MVGTSSAEIWVTEEELRAWESWATSGEAIAVRWLGDCQNSVGRHDVSRDAVYVLGNSTAGYLTILIVLKRVTKHTHRRKPKSLGVLVVASNSL